MKVKTEMKAGGAASSILTAKLKPWTGHRMTCREDANMGVKTKVKAGTGGAMDPNG